MHPNQPASKPGNEQTIAAFSGAFAQLDADAMARCHASNLGKFMAGQP